MREVPFFGGWTINITGGNALQQADVNILRNVGVLTFA